ncbi:MAG TPA: M90 family metallopeptidase [Parafilimonas sp.]|nr:M90 family metallopeptidase [Parafilimonas sp.]
MIWRYKRKHKVELSINYRELLQEHVAFYNKLDNAGRIKFENKIKNFLSYVRIIPVNTEMTELDKILVASSAVIPAFGFDWHYYNLSHVLLYNDTFDAYDFSVTAEDRSISGMVGTGALQRIMLLSKPALRQGFANEISRHNTGIHEFVHLLDKADGDTDGIPEELLEKQYTIPWIKYMSEEIERMKEGKSDINIYGATSQAEFFAVASEYFFGSPERFKINHPELFDMMTKIFHQEPDHERIHF